MVDASACDPSALKDVRVLAGLFEALVVELQLTVVGTPQWHVFPGPGGVTGLTMLSESHLAIHTFPEHCSAALSIYSCRARPMPDLEALLKRHLKARRVSSREVARSTEVMP